MASDTYVLRKNGHQIGFYVLRSFSDHLYLDHIYIHPAHQGGGIGRDIIRRLQEYARTKYLPLRLIALRGSRANDFYTSCGFAKTRSDAFDNHYEWGPNGEGSTVTRETRPTP